MARIHIQWLSDDWDCETCGTSYAEGAVVTITRPDRVEVINMEPSAHCYDGVSFDRDEVFRRILKELGHEVTE